MDDLRSALAFQQGILDSSEYAIIATRPDGVISAFNRGAERMLGYRAEELVGRCTPEVIHDQAEVSARARQLSEELGTPIAAGFEAFVATVRTGRAAEHEWTYVCKDGSRLPVLLSVTRMTDSDGRLTGFLGIAKDITARKRAEIALRESEEKFRQLAENIDEVFWMASGDGRKILYVSPVYEKIWGRSCESLYERSSDWLEGVHPEDRERVARAFFELGPKGQYDEEYRVVATDGRVRWVRARGSVVRSDDGEVQRIVGVVWDIGERKRYEQELEAARDEAQAANAAKSQFLAAMSHELRTPLHGAIGMADLLCDTKLTSRQRRFAEACRTSARSLLDLINDILDLSKIESGKLALSEQSFRLDQVVEDAVRLLGPRASEKKLELVPFVDIHLCKTVLGDNTRLQQVLINLIGNALKFTVRGEVAVRAWMETTAGQRMAVRFEVSDTGIGIPADRVGKLFQPFSQGDSSISRRFGGTGLGLVISRSLVEAMGGRMGVESQEGLGTTFWFTLEFKCQPQAGSPPAVPSDLRGLRVMISAKNESLAESLESCISSWRMTAAVTSSGEEAVSRLKEAAAAGNPFDLLIVDEELSEGSGRHLVDRLRSSRTLRSTRVFLLSTIEEAKTTRHQLLRRLIKPVCRSELLNAIIEWFLPSFHEAPSPDESTIEPVTEPTIQPGKVRVLLAEDNRINSLYGENLLRKAGLGCDSVGDGAAAVEAALRRSYDLVLMDCQMPEVDGFEATRRIRELERNGSLKGRLPIVALTANAVKGDRERCLAAGMDDYLSKPFEAAELMSVINRMLGRRAYGAGEPAAEEPLIESERAAPINLELLLARCMGDMSFAASLLDELEATGMERVERLAWHATEGDAAGAADEGHSLKGAAGILGAEPLSSLAAKVESAGKLGDLAAVAGVLDELRDEMARCLDYIPTVRAAT